MQPDANVGTANVLVAGMYRVIHTPKRVKFCGLDRRVSLRAA